MIKPIDHIINIDLTKKINTNQSIVIKKDDNASHRFLINIFNNSTPYDLTGLSAKIYFQKYDNTKVFLDCVLDDAITGKISCLLTTQVVSVCGLSNAEVTVYGTTGEILTTLSFIYVVSNTIRDDEAIESTSEFTALTNALVKVNNWDAQFGDKYAGLETEYAADLTEVKSGLANNLTQVTKNTSDITSTITKIGNLGNKATFKGSCLFSALPTTGMLANDYWYVSDQTTNYCYNGTSWVDIGNNINIGDGVITQKQMAVPYVQGVHGKNLFNKITAILGYYIDYTTGSLTVDANCYVSDYIAVIAGQQYKVSGTPQQLAFYNSAKQYISGYPTAGSLGLIPDGVSYVRLSMELTEINNVQLEAGTVSTSYESFTIKIGTNSYSKNTIDRAILTFPTLLTTPSINLFNQATITNDFYIEWNTGNVVTGTGMCASDYIEVLPNTQYKKIDSGQSAYYDINKTYISGLIDGKILDTPINCAYVRISIYTPSNVAIEQLELGGVSTPHEIYGANYLSSQYVKTPTASINLKPYVVVTKNGSGDYLTINQAISVAQDSVTNPVIILIMPGIYEETLNLIGRYITLKGIDKNTCIIKTFTNDYHYPPIDLSTNSHLENLTIIADDNEVTTPKDGISGLKSYAIHFDIAGRGYDINNILYQGIARVKNCILISKNNYAIGIGMSNKQNLVFEDCEVISFDTGTIYAHSYLPTGATQQKLTLKNCDLHNNSATVPTILLQDANGWDGSGKDTIDTEFTFINNSVWSEVNGRINAMGVLTPFTSDYLEGKIKLGKGSFGNSVSILNSI